MGDFTPARLATLDHLVGSSIVVPGWVDSVRNLKKMQFLVLRDGLDYLQAVNVRRGDKIEAVLDGLKPHSTVQLYGELIPNPSVKLGERELVLNDIEVTSVPQAPIPVDEHSGIDAKLDYRWIDLRRPSNALLFKIQTLAEQAMRSYWVANGFIEIHSPKLVAGATESGAELFTLDYFGTTASLAQSPQFYKQMAMAAGFGRVFEIGPVFRANSSHTKRHDTEFTSVDMEMSWIKSHEDIMQFEEQWLAYVLDRIQEHYGPQITEHFGVELKVPTIPFPRITLSDAHDALAAHGYVSERASEKGDLDPEGERTLAQIVKERTGHEFVFVTEYPVSVRPFYHMRSDTDPTKTHSFDLLWKGMEITTGAQREHRHDRLLAQAKDKGVDPAAVKHYLDFFRYGVPPHGGLGFGLTRMLVNMLELPSVREATFLYRGPTRLTP